MDRALPGKHTLTLYNPLKRREAAVLSQIRTGRARNQYRTCYSRAVSGSTYVGTCEQHMVVDTAIYHTR
ncbi:hypothetical protein BJ546DRAFT_982178 [Cryomyces antarcticus]